MSMQAARDPWQALHDELDQWQAAGRCATLWWRDDDAVGSSAQLRRLLEMAGAAGVPLCLAVVPAHIEPSLAPLLQQNIADVGIAVHGWAHVNHAAVAEKKSEFPQSRALEVMSAEAVQGYRALEQAFGARAMAVFVPPWNRVAASLVGTLADSGYRGLSSYKPRSAASIDGLAQVNTHVDIVNWQAGRIFAGEQAVVGALVDHLAARRRGEVEDDEPTGLLTHHLILQDDACEFVARLLRETSGHGATRWLKLREVFDG